MQDLVEYITAMGKESQVLRYRTATEDGIAAAKRRKEQSNGSK